MADWKVNLTRTVFVNGAARTLETEHVVEGTSRNLAIPIGIDELFKAEAATGYQLVPKDAVDYWNTWRVTGGQLYEFQTEIEGKWGISFGVSEIKDVTEPEPAPKPHRNGKLPTPTGELPDLTTMLENHLKSLTARQIVLGDELVRKQNEYDRNNSDIMRITQVLTTLTPAPARKPKKAKDVHAA